MNFTKYRSLQYCFDLKMIAKQLDPNIFITVITVVFNGEKYIADTINSVVQQQGNNIEYIVIDGKSSDKTLDIISNHNCPYLKCYSESDSGIYDAMNKGVSRSCGEWIIFMNAGDIFFDAEVIQNTIQKISMYNPDVVYGDVIHYDPTSGVEFKKSASPIENVWLDMPFHHQSVFVKRSLFISKPFDLQYKIAADYNLMLNLYLDGVSFLYNPITVSKVTVDGVSYSNIRTILEQAKIYFSYYGCTYRIVGYLPKIIIAVIRLLLGKKLSNSIRSMKWLLFHRQN